MIHTSFHHKQVRTSTWSVCIYTVIHIHTIIHIHITINIKVII